MGRSIHPAPPLVETLTSGSFASAANAAATWPLSLSSSPGSSALRQAPTGAAWAGPVVRAPGRRPATQTAWPMAFFEPTGTTCVSLGSLRWRARFVTPSASRLVVIVMTAQGRPESAGERMRRLHEDIDGGLDAGLD